MCVEKLYTDNNAQEHLHGNWFYRPNETFHLASRKFLEKVGHQSMNQMFPPKKNKTFLQNVKIFLFRNLLCWLTAQLYHQISVVFATPLVFMKMF